MLKEATQDHAAAEMKLTRQNDGKQISMTDTAGNRTDFDFKDYSVSSSFAGPAGKTLVTRGKSVAFLLVDAASYTPLYRLIPRNSPEKNRSGRCSPQITLHGRQLECGQGLRQTEPDLRDRGS